MNEGKRSNGVDMLRGIAILLVLILHFHLTYRLHLLPFDLPWLSDAIKAVARNGNYGVTMFFTVSGFLITSTSLRRFGSPTRIRPGTFYRFRASRILPCLVLALAIMVVLSLFEMRSFVNKPDTASMPVAVLSVLTFWHNVLMAQVGYFNYAMNILWSLSVEEVFYLSFPIVFLLLRRPRYIGIWLVVPILFAPYYRSLHAEDEIVALYGYLSCFDAIAMGSLVALLPARRIARSTGVALRCAAGLVLAVTYLSGPIMQHVVWGGVGGRPVHRRAAVLLPARGGERAAGTRVGRGARDPLVRAAQLRALPVPHHRARRAARIRDARERRALCEAALAAVLSLRGGAGRADRVPPLLRAAQRHAAARRAASCRGPAREMTRHRLIQRSRSLAPCIPIN